MAYTRTWDNTRPQGTIRVKELDDEMRNLRVDIAERLEDLYGVTITDDPLVPNKFGPGVSLFGAAPQYVQDAADLGDITGSVTIDFDARGNYIKARLTGNVTFTFSNMRLGASYVLILQQDGTGGRTITWPSSVRWPAGTTPTFNTTADRESLVVITPRSSTVALGCLSGTNYNVS